MASSAHPLTRVLWSWKSNADPFSKTQKEEWARYSDLQTDFIEENYHDHKPVCEMGDYVIDLKRMIQFRKDNPRRMRPIKRESVGVLQCLREERFGIAEKPRVISFSAPGAFFENTKLIEEWKKKNQSLFNAPTMAGIVEQAAEGILREARALDQELEGRLIAQRLLRAKNESQMKIHDRCICLYSKESFLYKAVNQALRNQDLSKVDTFGAYCYLLAANLYDDDKENSTLYRGCELTEEHLKDYQRAVGTQIVWSAFTSLSRSRKQAERFGSALFIIRFIGESYCSKDIAAISQYPDEEEVLMRPVHPLWVEKVDYDEKAAKYLIYMTDDPDFDLDGNRTSPSQTTPNKINFF